MRRRINVIKNIDWVTAFVYLVMIVLGWFTIYAAEYTEAHQSIFDFSQSYGKQLIWIGTSIIIASMVLIIESRFFSFFAYIFYTIIILLLIFTLFWEGGK